MKKKSAALLVSLFLFSINASVFAATASDNQTAKIAELEKRIAILEKVQAKSSEKSSLTFSGMFSTRYRVADYAEAGKASVISPQYRLRLDAKTNGTDSYVGFRFVTKAPNKSGDLFNDSWMNFGGDSDNNGNHNATIDRVFWTTKLGNGLGSLTVGQQALVVDPMNIIIDNTYYSFGGGKVSYKLTGLNNAAATAQYGRFYSGASLTGFSGWGNKSATDFNNVDIASLIVNGKVKDLTYTAGYANFRNPKAEKDLLTYTFGNVGYNITPKVGVAFELADNSADTDGTFWTSRVVYGDQNLNKMGQWNVSLQYIDAEKNAIFNRYAMLEGATGKNTNNPMNIWDARVNYAISPTTIFYVQRLNIKDEVAANNKNDVSMWKAELDVKF